MAGGKGNSRGLNPEISRQGWITDIRGQINRFQKKGSFVRLPKAPEKTGEQKPQPSKPYSAAAAKINLSTIPKIDEKQAHIYLTRKGFSDAEIQQILTFCGLFNSSNGVSLEERTRKALADTINEAKKIIIAPKILLGRNINAIISSLEKKNWEDFYSSILEGIDSNKAILIQY